MASSPAFAATAVVGAGTVPATADTSLTAPTNVTTVVTGASTGTKIEELAFVGLGTTVAGIVNVFLYDGSTYHLYDEILVSAVTASTTVPAWRTTRQYSNLFLASTSWSLRVTNTVAGNVSLVKVLAFGGSY